MSTSSSSNFRLLVCVSGVFFCYFIYGLLQEKITRGTFGEEKERFTFAQCLVFTQCVINAIFAKVRNGNEQWSSSFSFSSFFFFFFLLFPSLFFFCSFFFFVFFFFFAASFFFASVISFFFSFVSFLSSFSFIYR